MKECWMWLGCGLWTAKLKNKCLLHLRKNRHARWVRISQCVVQNIFRETVLPISYINKHQTTVGTVAQQARLPSVGAMAQQDSLPPGIPHCISERMVQALAAPLSTPFLYHVLEKQNESGVQASDTHVRNPGGTWSSWLQPHPDCHRHLGKRPSRQTTPPFALPFQIYKNIENSV